jgi:DNA-binding transcriptional ArsR family regulator
MIRINSKKKEILKILNYPTTVKELRDKTQLKWANLSLHMKDLTEKGLIMQMGKQGRSKVFQTNRFKLEQYFVQEEQNLENEKKELYQIREELM